MSNFQVDPPAKPIARLADSKIEKKPHCSNGRLRWLWILRNLSSGFVRVDFLAIFYVSSILWMNSFVALDSFFSFTLFGCVNAINFARFSKFELINATLGQYNSFFPKQLPVEMDFNIIFWIKPKVRYAIENAHTHFAGWHIYQATPKSVC